MRLDVRLKDGSNVRHGVEDVSLLSVCLMDDACATVRAVDWTCKYRQQQLSSPLSLLALYLSFSPRRRRIFSVSLRLFLVFSVVLSMLMSAGRGACIVSRLRHRLQSPQLVCFSPWDETIEKKTVVEWQSRNCASLFFLYRLPSVRYHRIEITWPSKCDLSHYE